MLRKAFHSILAARGPFVMAKRKTAERREPVFGQSSGNIGHSFENQNLAKTT
jgi:hypothetical protein